MTSQHCPLRLSADGLIDRLKVRTRLFTQLLVTYRSHASDSMTSRARWTSISIRQPEQKGKLGGSRARSYQGSMSLLSTAFARVLWNIFQVGL